MPEVLFFSDKGISLYIPLKLIGCVRKLLIHPIFIRILIKSPKTYHLHYYLFKVTASIIISQEMQDDNLKMGIQYWDCDTKSYDY